MKTKKFLSLLLSAIMCLTLFTYPVFADDPAEEITTEFTLAYYNINASIMEFQYSKDVTLKEASLTDGTNNIAITSSVKEDDPKTIVVKPNDKLTLKDKNYLLTVTANDGTTDLTTKKYFHFDVAWEEDFDSYEDITALENAGYALRTVITVDKEDGNGGKKDVPTTLKLSEVNTNDNSYVALVKDENGGNKLALKKYVYPHDSNTNGYNCTLYKDGVSVTHWYVIEATLDASDNTNNRPDFDFNRDPYGYYYADSLYSLRFRNYQTVITPFTKSASGANNEPLRAPEGKFSFVYDSKLPSADASSGIVNMYYNGALVSRINDLGKYQAGSQGANSSDWGTSDTAKDRIGLQSQSDNVQYIDDIRVYRVVEDELPADIAISDYSVTSQFVRINFNNAIDTASVKGENITFKSLATGNIAYTKSFENDNKTLVLTPEKALDIEKIHQIAVKDVKSADGFSSVSFDKGIKFDVYFNEDFDDMSTVADLDTAGYQVVTQDSFNNKFVEKSTEANGTPFEIVDDTVNGGKKLALKKGNATYPYYLTKFNDITNWYTIEMKIDSGENNRPILKINRHKQIYSYGGNGTNQFYSIRFSNNNWEWINIGCFENDINIQQGNNGNANSQMVPPTGEFSFIYEAKSSDGETGALNLYYDKKLAGTFNSIKYKSGITSNKFAVGSDTNDRVQYIDDIKVYRVNEIDLSTITELKEVDRDITTKAIRINYSKAITSTPKVTIKENGVAKADVTATKTSDKKSLDITFTTPLDLYKYYELDVANVSDEYGQTADSNQKFKFNVYWDEDFESYTDITELSDYYELIGYVNHGSNIGEFHKLETVDGNKKLQLNKAGPTAGGDEWSFRAKKIRNREEALKYYTVEFTATSTIESGGSFALNLSRHTWCYPGNSIGWNSGEYRYMNISGLFSDFSKEADKYPRPKVGEYELPTDDQLGRQDKNTQVTVNMDKYDENNDKATIFYDGIYYETYKTYGKFKSYGGIGFYTGRTGTEYIDDIKVYKVVTLSDSDNGIYTTVNANTVKITEDNVTGKFTVNNATDSDIAPMYIVAAYDKNGKLLSTQVITSTETAPTTVSATEIKTVDFEVTASGVNNITVFTWNNDIQPLTTVAHWSK